MDNQINALIFPFWHKLVDALMEADYTYERKLELWSTIRDLTGVQRPPFSSFPLIRRRDLLAVISHNDCAPRLEREKGVRSIPPRWRQGLE